jgi:hypothetical protein
MNAAFIIFLGLLGFPAVRATVRGQLRVLQSLRGVPFRMRVRIFMVFLLLLVTAIGIVAYLAVFVGELYVQVTCKGAACAQGGVGLLMFTPIAWLSYSITRAIAWRLFDGKRLPLLATPNFALQRTRRTARR